ncbi:hypothetical protein MPER_11829 [Moniliophthora perniciosa FA553]|nr:hypothetical protein MPER_11829 [Moniliophthora perniciosa FA553]
MQGIVAAVAFWLRQVGFYAGFAPRLKRNTVVCANEYKDPWITFDRPSQINFGLTVAFSALSDIIATLAIWWSCRRSKIGFKKSHSIVNKLVEYIVTRGILVTLFQIVYLVIFLAKTASLEWTVFQIAMSKVCNVSSFRIASTEKDIA